MKRVLILVNHDVVIYNFRLEIVKRLLKEGYEVYISSPYGERIDDLIELGCKYKEANISRHGTNIFEEIKLFSYYRKIIKEISPDVVLTFTIKPNIYGGLAARLKNIPYIVNITGLGTAVEKKSKLQTLSIILYKFALRKVNCVFFQNQENQQFFIDNKISLDKHKLIPGSGVNLEHFSFMEYPPQQTIEFVFISRIMKEKGIENYLEAAKYIREKYPYTKFHICGFCEEDYEDELIKLENEKIIIYHGMLRDIREIIKQIHCAIHPTYYPEGMSNVLLESAACGRPLITTDRSGCREIVDNGLNGYLIELQNTQDLIEKIEKFLNLKHEEKEKMGLKGREKVSKEFDRKIVVDSYLREIKQIVGEI